MNLNDQLILAKLAGYENAVKGIYISTPAILIIDSNGELERFNPTTPETTIRLMEAFDIQIGCLMADKRYAFVPPIFEGFGDTIADAVNEVVLAIEKNV